MANKLHDEVFEFMEEYRVTHPNFYYWLRERNNKNRLEDGFWFQGKETYAFVGLYDRSGGSNMTRSIGLVFFNNGNGNIRCQLEVVYNEEQDQRVLSFYKNLMNLLKGFGQEHKTKYTKLLSENEGFKAAKKFLDEEKFKVDALIKETGLNELFIDESDFNEKFKRVISYKTDYPNYWLFQGNPGDYDISIALKNNLLQDWSVAAHKDKIRPNDRVIIWMGGKNAGCYALAIVTSKPGIIKVSPDAHLYKDYDPNDLKVKISITHNLIEAPLLWSEIKNIPELVSLNQGYRGTNFSVTKNQFQTFLRLITEQSNNTKNEYMQPTNIEPFNQILYGPPGTGKTYHTVERAMKIIDPDFYQSNKVSRRVLTAEFKKRLIKDYKKNEGQIGFCTFHQSMSYEDFVEGLKPYITDPDEERLHVLTDTSGIKYCIEDGIFKIISRMASEAIEQKNNDYQKTFSLTESEFDKAFFYKMSLGDTSDEEDDQIYQYCMSEGYLALGWGGDYDYSSLDEKGVISKAKSAGETDFSVRQISMFINLLKAGNYVVISNGNLRFRAIGRITGSYEYRPSVSIRYHHLRKVEWILKDVDLPVSEIYTMGFQQQTLYKLNQKEIKKEFFIKSYKETKKAKIKQYVLIIDEINRGNIAQIFGELITLLEPDKRKGKEEELSVVLPYSKRSFTVPPNLYIIGTMNTADRSVEALDTALRRRFMFEEIQPDPNLISPYYQLHRLWGKYWWTETEEQKLIWAEKEKAFIELTQMNVNIKKYEELNQSYNYENSLNDWYNEDPEAVFSNIVSFAVKGLDLRHILKCMNERLFLLLTKDHTIGHAWLMDVYSLADLQVAYKNKILPLLQEYFYNNYAKIGLVLGDQFFEEPVKVSKGLFATFKGGSEIAEDYNDKMIYKFKDASNLTIENFKSIYEKPSMNTID